MKTWIEGKYNEWQLKEVVKHTRLNRHEREQLYVIIDNLKYPCMAINKVDPSNLFETLEQTHAEPMFDDLIRMLGELNDLKLTNLRLEEEQVRQEKEEQVRTQAMTNYFAKFGITDQEVMKNLQGGKI
ncbi:hypothetical protein A9Y76_07185 [Ralstonia insidiosa]|uniref:Uncharacterized protein n=1 Tax=Ralstonia insidiosa TaxID=190721 RepID=A0A191ZW03_9RALS|nr:MULTISPECIES: hypothetical protein [Burkholderiaceae]ANJ72262.1 hypothetical protein A9Y76_07185 [Ralstonia insidiosa]MBU9434178.1 hypothetical protein [Burkholderia multivorans]